MILKIEHNQALRVSQEKIPIARLKILTEFYAPELLDTLKNLEEQRKVFSKILSEVILGLERAKVEKQELNGSLVVTQLQISTLCQSMILEAALAAQKSVSEQIAKKTFQRRLKLRNIWGPLRVSRMLKRR